MKSLKLFIIIACSIISFNSLLSYDLPTALNLGTTNILDGGPKVESPGLYWIQYSLNYYANKFLNECGKPLGGVESPILNTFATFTEILYQSKFQIFGGAPGASLVLPPVVFSYTSCNCLNLINAEAGLSNPVITLFFQWDMINYHDRPLFIHRLGTAIFLPFGTNKFPEKTINPADIMTAVDTYWAGSFYITEHWATSWRLFYLWCGENKKTKITPGKTFHMNYSMEYEVYKNYWIAINGYYLQQLHNSTRCGIQIPNSKERVVSAGPGFLFFLPHNFTLVGHAYLETKAQNRTQGTTVLLDLIKYF